MEEAHENVDVPLLHYRLMSLKVGKVSTIRSACKSILSSDMTKDFVYNADKRLGCIEYDAITGDVFFGGV